MGSGRDQVERAFEIFYEMQEQEEVQPDEVTFNALISAACKGGLPSYAFDAFDIMKVSHGLPNLWHFGKK